MVVFYIKPFLPFLMLLIEPHPQKPLFPSWVHDFGLLAVLLCQELIFHSFEWVKQSSICRTQNPKFPPAMPSGRCRSLEARDALQVAESLKEGMKILDLPELALELILAKLSPAELCNMACVCSSLRSRCRSDHLWESHMTGKWRGVLGEAARKKWELQVASMSGFTAGSEVEEAESKSWMGKLICLWPLSWLKDMIGGEKKRLTSSLPPNSLMAFYLALQSGRFSFPAQVFNRENGHAGFLLSCYDAEISYNARSNKFYVRYPPHGKRVPPIEEVPWQRIRAPSVDTSANDLHISDCLGELYPGDHIEIQWRRNKDFPYGWWYGVVGHLEMCNRSEHRCSCHASDTIVLEFNHYAPGSRWRKKTLNRKEHREVGDENDGFYGGIRKIRNKEEISTWLQFWPA